ncbi:unnamed protein product [Brachionus calyciflorus]|uniref:Uncharacterized protein n=1 Tax=Brachionus calyciflorus TaxID=104777 RepID=A0A814K9B6_9BILA|nr:unnamed protein product [Brachionus calyciflorus]
MPEVISMIKNFNRFGRQLRLCLPYSKLYSSYYHSNNDRQGILPSQCIQDTCSHVWIEGENFEQEWWNNYEEDSDSSSESNDSIEVVWSTPTISHGYNQLSQANTTHVEGKYG